MYQIWNNLCNLNLFLKKYYVKLKEKGITEFCVLTVNERFYRTTAIQFTELRFFF